MNTVLHVIRRNKPAIFIALLASSTLAASADDATTEQQNTAYRQAVAQEALQKEMASVQAELSAMREEMKKLLPQDVPMIDRAFKQIGSLSSNEMKATIEALRAAAKSGDVKTQLEKLSEAYKDQTAAIIQIKNISGELSARKISFDISEKLGAVLLRQVADMDEVARIAQAGLPAARLPEALKRRHVVVIGDQTTVADDVRTSIQQINDAVTSLPADAGKLVANASAIAAQQRLGETADNAAALTRDGKFDQAKAAQQSTVIALAMTIHALSSDEKIIEQLQELSTAIGQTIEEQNTLAAAMAGSGRNIFPYEMQKHQIDISDKTGTAGAVLTMLNGKASGLVFAAQASMEKAVVIASGDRREDKAGLAPSQQTAVTDLDAAKKEIDQLIVLLNANKQPDKAGMMAALDSLLREVQQAAMDESRVALAARTPNSPYMPTAAQQKTFSDHVADLQQRAMAVSPEAAQAIGEASQQLAALANATQQDVIANDHQAAAQDLARAADILARQLAAEQEKSKQQAALADALSKLADAQQQTTAAQTNLQSNQTSATAVNQLATAKSDLNTAQQDATAAGADPATTTALTQAGNAVDATQMAAATQQLPAAQSNANAAQTSMANAQAGLQSQQGTQTADSSAPGAPGQGQQQGQSQAQGGQGQQQAQGQQGQGGQGQDQAQGQGQGGQGQQAQGQGQGQGGQGQDQAQGQGQGQGQGGQGQAQGQGQGQGGQGQLAQGQGQGQGGQGQGQGQTPGQGGQGQGQGTSPGTGTGSGGQGSAGDGMGGATSVPGAASDIANAQGAPVQVVSGLSPQDRAAVSQLQNQQPPLEFAPQVQQYYKNLADGAGL